MNWMTGRQIVVTLLKASRRDLAVAVVRDIVTAKEKWSKKVKTKWHPPEGFFKRSASEIASGLLSASDSKKQAMSRLNFYINRAGKNLSAADKKRLESAKKILSGGK